MDRKIIKNTAWLSFANLLARAIGFFYFIFLARILGVEQFGHYSIAIALVYNFYPVADFGIERLILRDISKDKRKGNEYFQKIVPLRFFLAFLSVLSVTFLGLILSNSFFDVKNILIFSFCLLPWTFNQLVAGIGNALEKMEIQSVVIVFSSLFTAIGGSFIVLITKNVSLVLAAAILSNLLVTLILFRLIKKIGLTFVSHLDLKFWKEILKESWVFALIMIEAVFYLRSSIVLVNYFKGAYYTGLYSSAFKFIEASLLFPQSFALALFPQTARLLINNKKDLESNYLKSLGLILFFSILYFLLFYFFAPLIIKTSYGSSYLEAVSVMRILGFAAIPFFMNSLPGNIIQNTKEVKPFLFFAFLNLFLVIIFEVVLISKYSIVGAAIAVFLGEVVGFIINNAFVWKILNERN